MRDLVWLEPARARMMGFDAPRMLEEARTRARGRLVRGSSVFGARLVSTIARR